jgi:DNA-binding response OmpR family regulator
MTALQTMRDLTTRAKGHTSPISVIIVDRSRLLVDSFQHIMECAGFNVETARSGEEAICKADITHFDLAIVENNLLDIAGRDLILMLKEQTPGISVMILNSSIENDLVNNNNLKAVDQDDFTKVGTSVYYNR